MSGRNVNKICTVTTCALATIATSVLSWEGLQLAGVEGSSLGPAQAMEEL